MGGGVTFPARRPSAQGKAAHKSLMNLPDFVWPVVLAVGCVQGLFLGFVLARLDSPNRVAVGSIALLVLCCALMIAEEWADSLDLYQQMPHLLYSTMLMPLLIGPLFLIHAQALTNGKQRLSWKDALHGVPFIVGVLYFAPLYVLDGAAKLDSLHLESYRTDILVWGYLKGVHNVVYLALALQMLNRAIQKSRASPDRVLLLNRLLWPRRIVWVGLASIAGIYALLTLMLLGVDGLVDSDQFGGLMMTSVIYLQAFVAIKHPASVQGPRRGEIGSRTRIRRPKYAKSTMSAAEKQAALDTLQAYMGSKRPYRDPAIRLETVAEAIALSTHDLSQVINEEAGMNFREYINTFRVEEVKQALIDPDLAHFSILGLAFDAGFSSKASFNRVFKQHTGLTPTGYQQQARIPV